MNVLSLFNGMSTGHTALDNVGIKVDKYYSSEIKPHAIELTQHHYPDTIQLGDVTKWEKWDIDYSAIDMVLSGSPCQDLSAAGKRAGLYGSRSSLFFVFVDILNHIKKSNPNVLFLQENVGSASRGDVGIMSRELGVYPVRINSKLVTAQLRDRYYWTNIRTRQDGLFGELVSDIPQPKDRKIMFKDIIVCGAVEKEKSGALLQGDFKMFIKDEGKQDIYLKKRLKNGTQTPPLVYVDTDKHTCLNTGSGVGGTQEYLTHRNETTGMITLIYEENNELRCKTNTKKGYEVITDDDCVDLLYPSSTTRRSRITKGKSPCLLTSNNIYKKEGMKLRTVNKIEMCRLQGFPDDWCDILTKAKAGSLLGDGWTLPVIEHIFSFIKEK